jgi:hypothetical protein
MEPWHIYTGILAAATTGFLGFAFGYFVGREQEARNRNKRRFR